MERDALEAMLRAVPWKPNPNCENHSERVLAVPSAEHIVTWDCCTGEPDYPALADAVWAWHTEKESDVAHSPQCCCRSTFGRVSFMDTSTRNAEQDALRIAAQRADGALADAGTVPTGDLERGIRALTAERDAAVARIARLVEAITSVLKDSENNPLAALIRNHPGSSYAKLEAALSAAKERE